MEYKLLSSIFYSDKDNYETHYSNRFNSESTYRFKFKIDNNNAFVVINNNILQNITKIMELDKELFMLASKVPTIAINQYIKKCMIDEILMTNEIEGVHSTRKEIKDILKLTKDKKNTTRFFGIVKKYQLLHDEINLDTCKDVRSLYNEFALEDVLEEDPSDAPDGQFFRQNKVSICDKYGKEIHKGLLPESKIIDSMTECLDALNDERYNYFIRVAIFHYMFGYIHPFYNGNGRTSRFISSYFIHKKLHPLVAYRLSYTIKKNIDSYYKSFKIVNDEKNKGDMTYFVINFLDIIVQSIKELYESLEYKNNKLQYYNDIVIHIPDIDERMTNLIFILVQNTLFGEQGLSVNDLKEISGYSDSKIRATIKYLEEIDLLDKSKDSNKFIYDINLDNLSKLK